MSNKGGNTMFDFDQLNDMLDEESFNSVEHEGVDIEMPITSEDETVLYMIENSDEESKDVYKIFERMNITDKVMELGYTPKNEDIPKLAKIYADFNVYFTDIPLDMVDEYIQATERMSKALNKRTTLYLKDYRIPYLDRDRVLDKYGTKITSVLEEILNEKIRDGYDIKVISLEGMNNLNKQTIEDLEHIITQNLRMKVEGAEELYKILEHSTDENDKVFYIDMRETLPQSIVSRLEEGIMLNHIKIEEVEDMADKIYKTTIIGLDTENTLPVFDFSNIDIKGRNCIMILAILVSKHRVKVVTNSPKLDTQILKFSISMHFDYQHISKYLNKQDCFKLFKNRYEPGDLVVIIDRTPTESSFEVVLLQSSTTVNLFAKVITLHEVGIEDGFLGDTSNLPDVQKYKIVDRMATYSIFNLTRSQVILPLSYIRGGEAVHELISELYKRKNVKVNSIKPFDYKTYLSYENLIMLNYLDQTGSFNIPNIGDTGSVVLNHNLEYTQGIKISGDDMYE